MKDSDADVLWEGGAGRVVAMQPHGSPSKVMHWPPQTMWFSEGKCGLAEVQDEVLPETG